MEYQHFRRKYKHKRFVKTHITEDYLLNLQKCFYINTSIAFTRHTTLQSVAFKPIYATTILLNAFMRVIGISVIV